MKPRSAKNDQPDSVRGGSLFSKGRVDLGSTRELHPVTIPSIAREDPSDTLISTGRPPTPAFPCQDMRPPVLPKAHGGLFYMNHSRAKLVAYSMSRSARQRRAKPVQ